MTSVAAHDGGKPGRGILVWKLRRNIGAAFVRANATLLMDRVAHTGVTQLRLIRGSPGRSLGSFRGSACVCVCVAEASHAHRQQRNAAPRWEAP